MRIYNNNVNMKFVMRISHNAVGQEIRKQYEYKQVFSHLTVLISREFEHTTLLGMYIIRARIMPTMSAMSRRENSTNAL